MRSKEIFPESERLPDGAWVKHFSHRAFEKLLEIVLLYDKALIAAQEQLYVKSVNSFPGNILPFKLREDISRMKGFSKAGYKILLRSVGLYHKALLETEATLLAIYSERP